MKYIKKKETKIKPQLANQLQLNIQYKFKLDNKKKNHKPLIN